MEKIGMIGLGAMGSALLGRLTLARTRVTAYDCDPRVVDAGLEGADFVRSPAEVARASTLIDVVVRTDQDVMDCMTGKDGVLEGAQAGTLVLLHSSISPKTTQAMAEAAQARGVSVIDACMTGVPKVVKEGGVTFLVGGPAELVERARPHLLKMGKQVLHMGPLGAGNAAKLIKNLVTGAETLVVHEAIRIGEAAGIPYRDALEMMRQAYSGTILDSWQERFDPSGASSTPAAGTNLYQKDLPLAAELGHSYGVDIPITDQLVAAGRRLLAK